MSQRSDVSQEPRTETGAAGSGPWQRLRRRVVDGLREIGAGLPVPVLVMYAVSTVVCMASFAHLDLHWTINNAYAYLQGHVGDFYDYNLVTANEASYFPSVYVVFAAWMAPLTWFVGSDGAPRSYLSSWEIAWAKPLLAIAFFASAYVLAKIAKELFGDDPQRRRVTQAAYLLSPFATFLIMAFGQYDVFSTLFTLLGFLYYLRGDKWRFALFFSVAASFKYFPLIIFVPLLLLQYKKLRDLVLLSLVAGSVLVLEALPYLGSTAFREKTLLGLAASKVSDPGQRPLLVLAVTLCALGCLVLWRITPTRTSLGPLAVHSAAVGYGLMLTAIAWHPQWFIILTPFYALSLGYLRRPGRFLIWESAVFVAFIWYVVDRFPANVDVTMVIGSALDSVLGRPTTIMSSLYPPEALPVLSVILTAFLLSPTLFYVLERVEARNAGLPMVPVPARVWTLRVLTVPVAFLGVAFLSMWMPISVAAKLDQAAGTYGLPSAAPCSANDAAYGDLYDGHLATQGVRTDGAELYALSITVGTSGRVLDGDVILVLRDQDGDVVARREATLATVPDNSPVFLTVPDDQSTRGTRDFELTVETRDVEEDAGIAVWGMSTSCSPGALRLGDERQIGDLNVHLFYAEG